MPDAEHGGPGSGNQDGSGAGSGHGSGGGSTDGNPNAGYGAPSTGTGPNTNYGGNPADANNPGVGTNQNEADNQDFDTGYSGNQSFDNAPYDGFDPSAAPVGVGTNQNLANQQNFNSFDSTVDAIDTDYGYYDGVTVTTPSLGWANPNVNQTPAYDPANVESQVMGQTQQTNYGPTFSGMTSPMGFGLMSNNAQNLAAKNAANAAMAKAFGMDEAEARARTMAGLSQYGQNLDIGMSANPSLGFDTNQSPNQEQNLEAQRSRISATNKNLSYDFATNRSPNFSAPSIGLDDHDADLANLTGATVSNRTAYQGPGKRGYAPPGYERHEDNSMNITEQSVQSFVDFVNRNILDPRQKAKAIKGFMEKHKMGLRELSIKNAKEYDIGMLGYLPGIGLMNTIGKGMRALAEKMGLTPGVNTPAMNALEQAARQAGVMDKETGEYTVEEMRATCNGMQGYRWDEGSQSCVPIQQDAETGAINPYNGMISSP